VLIDDEPAALSITENKFKTFFPQIEIIGSFKDPEKALAQITELRPSIIVLDIQMPRMNGFELLEKLKYKSFELIFSTAYDQYAIKAFEFSAIGYLLKPFMDQDFVVTINRALENINIKNNWQNSYKLYQDIQTKNSKKINIPTPEGFMIKEIDHIVRVESINRYSNIYFSDGTHIRSSYNIGKFISLLDKEQFLIPHQSHLVNKKYILMYLKSGFLKLHNEEHIPISKSRKAQITAFLGF